MKIQLIHITEQEYKFKDEVKKGYRAVFYYPDIRGGFAETFRVTEDVYLYLRDWEKAEPFYDSRQLRYNSYGVVYQITDR